MELRHKLPLVTAAVIVTLIMGTRFISTVLTEDIGSVDPRVTLPPNQVHAIRERQRRQQLRAFASVSYRCFFGRCFVPFPIPVSSDFLSRRVLPPSLDSGSPG